jgi:single-strand DNA-binding protein
MRYLPSGKAVTNISVATNRRWTDNDGVKQDETTWFRVSVWGAQAEAVNNYLKQGSKVMIEGRLRPDPETGGPKLWTSNEGQPGANFEITAQNVLFLSSRSDDEAYQPGSSSAKSDPVDEDDIPF